MNKNRIGCNVKTCVYNTQCECTAEKIEVGCDECIQPCCDHETRAGPSRKRPSAKAKEKLILPQAAGEKKQFLFLSILRSEKTIREKVVPQGRLSASVFLFEGCIKSGL